MQNAGSLVVLGSINADHILNLQSFPTPGETVTGNHYQVAFGGKGANQAVAAGRSGANIAFIACTGDDSIGESVRQQLATDNIDITPVSVIKGESTGVALIFVNGEGENVIGIHAGANAALSPALVEAQRERIANASALLMQLESPLESVMAAAKIAHQNKTIVALNPAPARELPDELLALVDIITPNETEAEKLTGIRVENDEDAAKAAQVLHEKGIRTVLITLGSRGVWASVNGEGQRVPGFRVQAVDTIAAGDTFNGALITALLEEKPLPEAIRFAHAAAAIAVTRKGAQPSVPWREAITAKVEAAIKELNYAPSALARSLKLNQTHTIGMLITASTNPFYSELVRGVERSCFERGYSLVLCNTEGDEQRMNRNLETLMQKRVDGLLLLCTETHQPSREIMQRYPTVPTVMMDWAPFDGDSDLIQDNSLLGGDLATQYLIDKGHTRIACITGPLDKTPARLRLEGYRAAMKRAGLNIPDGYEVTGDFEFNGGFDAMRQLLSHPLRPQAVFTGNDAMAVGVYQALYQAELQVPQDIAVIGYDDIELASFMTPPLTTIHQPKDELGELAIDVLIHRITQPTLQQQRLQLTPILMERGSA
ncbi:ribose operon transcriptional repressor RbsR [Escherichia coli]|nr:ribose operon transcriptional repressor RbsR [Escherichia coli]MDS1726649.1 ribose operon transcriptional repressor RbsR [Escherichia coli]